MEHTDNKRVIVVIPVYTDSLSADEHLSLARLMDILGSFPITIVKPHSLSGEKFRELYPTLHFESFPDNFFNGIKAYNTLMISDVFYERFLEYDYMLIHQLDAYIFRNELLQWCDYGYDYVGAPWVRRAVYEYPLIREYMKLERWVNSKLKKPDRQSIYNRVGNGGLSLRRVRSHYDVTINCKEAIGIYKNARQYHLYNEDVFWSVEVNRWLETPFKYPDYIKALGFSFDKHPDYCYKLAGKKLPFGCHAWNRSHVIKFWKQHIF